MVQHLTNTLYVGFSFNLSPVCIFFVSVLVLHLLLMKRKKKEEDSLGVPNLGVKTLTRGHRIDLWDHKIVTRMGD